MSRVWFPPWFFPSIFSLHCDLVSFFINDEALCNHSIIPSIHSIIPSILSFPPFILSFILSFPPFILSFHSFYHSLHSFLTLSQASPSVKWRRFISSSFSSKHTNSNKPTTTNNAPNLSIASNPLRSLSSCMSMRTMSNFPPPSITPSFWRESNVCSNKNNRS